MSDVRHRDELSPSYSWYIRDWRASHRVSKLSWKERGFYRECLDWSWDLDGLPNDLEFIRDRVGATKGDFGKLWPAARGFYDLGADGRLRNARQEAEREKLRRYLRRASDGGKATARSTRLKQALEAPAISTESEHPPEAAPVSSALLLPSLLPSPLPLQKEREAPASLSPPADPFVDSTTTERAGAFLDRYEALYPKYRHGAKYARKPVRDYAAAVTLCHTWADDARLDKLAVIFLTTDHKFAEEGSRTVPQFLGLASWCDGKLAEHEAKKAVTP